MFVWLGSGEEDDSRGTLSHSGKIGKNCHIRSHNAGGFWEVANVVAAVAKMGIKVEQIDKFLDEIGPKRYHNALLQEAWMLRKRIEELAQEKKCWTTP